MRQQQTGTGPGMSQRKVHGRSFAQAYIVDVQALSIHANDNLVSLSFLQTAVTKHRRGIDAAVFRIQWLRQRCDCIRCLHSGHFGGDIAPSSSTLVCFNKTSLLQPAPADRSSVLGDSTRKLSGAAGRSWISRWLGGERAFLTYIDASHFK
jgi:hypothetical protein